MSLRAILLAESCFTSPFSWRGNLWLINIIGENMAQFYFLSVLLNIICGLICVYGKNASVVDLDDGFDGNATSEILDVEKNQEGDAGEPIFSNPMFNLVSGALCLVTGIVILLVPYKGPSLLGDLLPALAAILGGASVLLSYLENRSDEFVAPEILDVILVSNKFYIGVACLLFAVLHFIAPGAWII